MIAALIAPAALSLAQEAPQPARDPAGHPWASWKPGSHVRRRNVHESSGRREVNEVEHRLDRVGDGRYAIRTTWIIEGKPRPETEEVYPIPRRVAAGKETMRVGEREYACTIWKTDYETKGGRFQTQEWFAEGVPLPLKIVENFQLRGSRYAGEIVAVKLDHRYAIGDRELTCVKYEGTCESGTTPGRQVRYLCADVPGWEVYLSQESDADPAAGGARTRTTSSLVQFEALK